MTELPSQECQYIKTCNYLDLRFSEWCSLGLRSSRMRHAVVCGSSRSSHLVGTSSTLQQSHFQDDTNIFSLYSFMFMYFCSSFYDWGV